MASLCQIGANGVERLDVSLNQINSFFSLDPEFWKVGTKSFFHVIFNEKKIQVLQHASNYIGAKKMLKMFELKINLPLLLIF